MKALFIFCIVLFSPIVTRAQSPSNFIVVDQFGYLPDAPKIAVIRDPVAGFDSHEAFTPGQIYALVNVHTGEHLFTATPVAWNNGNTDASSGDRVWWFDFSSVSALGSFFVLDVENNIRSHEFRISPTVYNEVLHHAFRTFFYQRAGFEKLEPFAERPWADSASHLGPLQDRQARLYSAPSNAATERDVSGGWFDAGDYNKYTNWTADYIIGMMHAFLENPMAWGDNFNIPESGNGIPDLLDEARWGLDHLLKMQEADGGVLSIAGLSHNSPPSAATGPTLYGPASTSATLSAAGAFAIASIVFRSAGITDYAQLLLDAAIKGWDWAEANPRVTFRNNDPSPPYFSANLGAGQQEVDDYGRLTKKIQAACFLFAATGDARFRNFFDSNYMNVNMMQWWFAFPFQAANQDMLLFYTSLPGATPSVANEIKQRFNHSMMNTPDNFPAVLNSLDPYRAHIKDYTWGSNNTKSLKGNMFLNVTRFGTGTLTPRQTRDAALGYINYLHGVNPLNFVYLSNMFNHGAENGVREFYHTWFHDRSHRWDRVGTSVYGPPPGFVTGGPNPFYNWDGCCPSACGSAANNALCFAENISPPRNQPAQKSYKDFNTNWPLNSWEITENSNGYQISYIRLLANFVKPGYDCNGDSGGTAFLDACGRCAGGNTGIVPVTNPLDCTLKVIDATLPGKLVVYPNPASNRLFIARQDGVPITGTTLLVSLVDASGRVIKTEKLVDSFFLDVDNFSNGIYFLKVEKMGEVHSLEFMVEP